MFYRRNSYKIIILVGFLLEASRCFAEEAADSAEALFKQGRDELAAGNFEIACKRLRQSDELDPAPGTKLNLGECEAMRGRVATAWELFRDVEQHLLAGDVRLALTKAKRAAMEPRLPKLVVTRARGAPEQTRVRLGDREIKVGPPGEAIVLDPGEVELVVFAPGYGDRVQRVKLEEGKVANVEVFPIPPARPATAPAAAAPFQPNVVARPAPAAPVEPRQVAPLSHRSSGWVWLGLGIGSGALGGVLGLLTLDARRINQEHCDEAGRTCDSVGRDAASRGRTLGVATTAGLAMGAVAIGIGIYLLTESSETQRRSATLRLSSRASTSEVVLEGQF